MGTFWNDVLYYQTGEDSGDRETSRGAEAVLDAVDALIEKVVNSTTEMKNATFDKPNLCKSLLY